MKPAVATSYGPPDAIRVEEIEMRAPGADQAIIAATVTAGDWRVRSLNPVLGTLPEVLWAALASMASDNVKNVAISLVSGSDVK